MIFKEHADLNMIFIYFHMLKLFCVCSFVYLPFAFSHLMPLYGFNVSQTGKSLQNVLNVLLPTSATHN